MFHVKQPKRKHFIFFGTHQNLICIRLIFVTAEVKQTMNTNTIQLIQKRNRKTNSILRNTVNTDKQITTYNITFRIIERDDVRVIVVVEVLTIHLQQILIGTKNHIDISELLLLQLTHLRKPRKQKFRVDTRNRCHIFYMNFDHCLLNKTVTSLPASLNSTSSAR